MKFLKRISLNIRERALMMLQADSWVSHHFAYGSNCCFHIRSLHTDSSRERKLVYHMNILFAVSSSTLKRVCRKNGIYRWPHRKKNKIDSAQPLHVEH